LIDKFLHHYYPFVRPLPYHDLITAPDEPAWFGSRTADLDFAA
jgi:hypothetical protein